MRIKGIYGVEPQRDQESATAHVVGFASYAAGGRKFTVDQIAERTENMGSYGILWFDVYEEGHADPVVSMNAMAVAEVHRERD